MTVAFRAHEITTPTRWPVRAWLFAIAGLVAAMILVGGAVRLTDSGLSITEWQPLLGAVPPLSDAAWQEAFAKYRQIPEFKIVNRGMGLAEFQTIYWWEWTHRFLGRFIGAAVIVPFAIFWLAGALPRRLMPKIILLFVLGGLQGALGWYMVRSGLVDRVDVSQYRLAVHLSLAVIILGYALWLALDLKPAQARAWEAPSLAAAMLTVLILLQIALGGLVAGLDAGKGYNTWPLIDGRLVPEGLTDHQPLWRNLFENVLTVQFDHRMVAYVVLIAVLANVAWLASRGAAKQMLVSASVMTALALAQATLGVLTLLALAPPGLSLAHQAGAIALFAASVFHLWRIRRSPENQSLASA